MLLIVLNLVLVVMLVLHIREQRRRFADANKRLETVVAAAAEAVAHVRAGAEELAPEQSEMLLGATGVLIADFARAVQEGTRSRAALCPESAARLQGLLNALAPAQRPNGARTIFLVLLNTAMTAYLDRTLRPMPAEPKA
jgi:hypothetical protein